jgi:hypothetical protein
MVEYSEGTFRQRLCAYCGDLSPYLRSHGRIIHKEACPHRQEPYSQTYPDRTLADERAKVLAEASTQIKAGPAPRYVVSGVDRAFALAVLARLGGVEKEET